MAKNARIKFCETSHILSFKAILTKHSISLSSVTMLYFHTISFRISMHLLSCWPPAEVENSYTKKSANVLTCATRALAPILSSTLLWKKRRSLFNKDTSTDHKSNQSMLVFLIHFNHLFYKNEWVL